MNWRGEGGGDGGGSQHCCCMRGKLLSELLIAVQR